MDQDSTMTLIFRCPPQLMGVLPPPIPAVQGLPEWFKALPHTAFNAIAQAEGQTVKRCPPFIEAPPNYSLLITHPVNRTDLPFTTLTGLVDSDLYHDSRINFPAHWHDLSFTGVLPKGTPVAQCIPVRRERWDSRGCARSRAPLNREPTSIGGNSGRQSANCFRHAARVQHRSAAA